MFSKCVHRSVCDVLMDMRRVLNAGTIFAYRRNINLLETLVEEMQVYVNRMEAALEYGVDLDKLHQKRKELSRECTALSERIKQGHRDFDSLN